MDYYAAVLLVMVSPDRELMLLAHCRFFLVLFWKRCHTLIRFQQTLHSLCFKQIGFHNRDIHSHVLLGKIIQNTLSPLEWIIERNSGRLIY